MANEPQGYWANEGNLDAARRLLHPQIEWVIAREHPDSRTLIGHESIVAYERDWQETLSGLRFVLDRVLDAGENVVGIGSVVGTGTGSGADVRVPIAFVFTVRDGLITRVEEYLDPREALEATGLAQ
jgi:ketosteroid isomerase-like protein